MSFKQQIRGQETIRLDDDHFLDEINRTEKRNPNGRWKTTGYFLTVEGRIIADLTCETDITLVSYPSYYIPTAILQCAYKENLNKLRCPDNLPYADVAQYVKLYARIIEERLARGGAVDVGNLHWRRIGPADVEQDIEVMELARTRLKNSVSANATEERTGGNGIRTANRALTDKEDSTTTNAELQGKDIAKEKPVQQGQALHLNSMKPVQEPCCSQGTTARILASNMSPDTAALRVPTLTLGPQISASEARVRSAEHSDEEIQNLCQRLKAVSPAITTMDDSIRRVEECRAKDDLKSTVSANLAAEKGPKAIEKLTAGKKETVKKRKTEDEPEDGWVFAVADNDVVGATVEDDFELV